MRPQPGRRDGHSGQGDSQVVKRLTLMTRKPGMSPPEFAGYRTQNYVGALATFVVEERVIK